MNKINYMLTEFNGPLDYELFLVALKQKHPSLDPIVHRLAGRDLVDKGGYPETFNLHTIAQLQQEVKESTFPPFVQKLKREAFILIAETRVIPFLKSYENRAFRKADTVRILTDLVIFWQLGNEQMNDFILQKVNQSDEWLIA